MYEGSNKPIILFATPPPLDQLCALTIRLSASAQSVARFQPQVIKCREFIFTEPEVIGTPSADINDHCFHLVAKVSFMNAGKLQARMSRIGLQTTRPYPVTTELYESCLRYTLLARLSPNWNKAGPWLVQGRDFLTHKGCANAVKMNVRVSHNELFFTLEAAVLKLVPLQVTDLDIMGKHLEMFLTSPTAQLDHDSIASDWCFILPSMKRGRIFSISHEIPEDSPFKTYRDLKRHWKNTYGYRLPESEEDMNFYQIRFGPLGGKLFTYPEVCLRGRDLQKMARVDPKPILRSFMLEIQSKFPTVCGCPIKLQSKAKFPSTDLLASGQETVQKQPNLTNKMNSSRPAVYRSKAEMEKMLTSTCVAPTPLQTSYIQSTGTSGTIPQVKSKSQDFIGMLNDGTNNSIQLNGHEQRKCLEPFNHKDNSIARSNQNTTSGSIRPITNKQPLTFVSSQQVKHVELTETTPELVNVHGSGRNKAPNTGTDNSSVGRSSVTTANKCTPSHSSLMNDQETVSHRLFPQFKPKNLCPVLDLAKLSSAQKIVPVFYPQKKVSSIVTGSQVKAKSTVNKPFISHVPSQISNLGIGQQTSIQVQRHVASFQRSTVTPSSHKQIPTFNKANANKTMPSFQKSGTPSIPSVPPKKGNAKIGKVGKEQKDKKATKRPKAVKKETQSEIKKAKKLKKAEA
ncbi:uncharacterized protein C18orf63-like [Mercenaria mercenaria]|uniref:uncharacterized protein C18orf63-like n=1 Tax=Mercenaria mercenaria TaxID=6596 RepID=UPI00234EC35B|nr:uncharacterized protein C18orf63-like [Mercenaria mercenaria]